VLRPAGLMGRLDEGLGNCAKTDLKASGDCEMRRGLRATYSIVVAMRSQEANQWQRHVATGPSRKTGAKSAIIPPAMVSDKKETCARKQGARDVRSERKRSQRAVYIHPGGDG